MDASQALSAEEVKGGGTEEQITEKGGETEDQVIMEGGETETLDSQKGGQETPESGQEPEKGGETPPVDGEMQNTEKGGESESAIPAENAEAQRFRQQLTELQERLARRYGLTPNAAGEIDHAALLSALDRETRHREGTERIYRTWLRQAAEFGQRCSGFDLRREAANPEFLRLLRGGADPETAYRAAHLEDYVRGAMQYAARQAAQRTARQVAANGLRPKENGGGALPASGNDVRYLTDEDLEEITRRVRRGETISFG